MAITLYDAGHPVPGKSMSPFTNKIRMILNYKGIQHKTVFLKATEVEPSSIALGLPPNELEKLAGGVFNYTIPVLRDSEKEKYITDSFRIARYLDEAYPDTPQVLPLDTVVAQIGFEGMVYRDFLPTLVAVVGPKVMPLLDEGIAFRYKMMLEATVGSSLEEYVADQERAKEFWGKVKANFDGLDTFFRKAAAVTGVDGADGPFSSGRNIPLYIDFVLAAFLLWIVRAVGEDDDLWKDLRTWNEGRWARLYDALKEYMVIYE